MAERPLFQQTPQSGRKKVAMPQPVVQQSNTRSLEAFMNIAANAHEHIVGFLDKTVRKEGKKEGLKAAKVGKFIERDSVTVRSQAYNAAGREGYKAGILTEMSNSMNDIYKANKHDPELLGNNLSNYQKEMLSKAEEVSPEAALSIQISTDNQISGMVNASSSNSQKVMVEAAAAEVNAGVAAITNNSMFMARNVSPDISLISNAQSRTQLEQVLIANGPSQVFAEDKSLYLSENGRKTAMEPNADRTGALTPSQIKATLQSFDDKVVVEQYMWGMDRAIEIDKGQDYIRNFVDHPNPGLTQEQSDTIKSEMFASLKAKNASHTAMTKNEKDEREATWLQTNIEQTALVLGGQHDPRAYQELVASGKMKPADAERLLKLGKSGGPPISNELELTRYTIDGLWNADPMEIMNNPQLSFEDRHRLVTERQEILDNQDEWRTTPSGQQGASDIKASLGIYPGIDPRMLSQDKVLEIRDAMNSYWDAVNDLPLDKRRSEAPKVAKQIIRDRRISVKDKELTEAEDKRDNLDFPTVEAVDAAVAAGDEKLVNTFLGMEFKRTEEIQAHKDAAIAKQKRIDRIGKELEAERKR